MHPITKALAKNEYVISVFLDFQKAFDRVDHSIPLKKLSKLGLLYKELRWFKSYLSDRKQYVMVNGVPSDFSTFINISVLQGSILGWTFIISFLY